MRHALLLAALALASCSEEQSDADKLAAVERAQDIPAQAIEPQPIDYRDIEANDLFGAGCNFSPDGGGMGATVLAKPDVAHMKIDGEIERFAPDVGAGSNPLDTWQKYDGTTASFRLELGEGDFDTGRYPGTLTMRDGQDRIVYRSGGSVQCGS